MNMYHNEVLCWWRSSSEKSTPQNKVTCYVSNPNKNLMISLCLLPVYYFPLVSKLLLCTPIKVIMMETLYLRMNPFSYITLHIPCH